MGRTQRGNNNAYCQDNETSWLDWSLDARRRSLLAFTIRLIRLRKAQPVLQRRRFFHGATLRESTLKDAAWFRPDGAEMTARDWQEPYIRAVAFLLGGDAIATPDERGRRIVGDSLLVCLNASHEALTYTLPDIEWGGEWELIIDTSGAREEKREHVRAAGRLEVGSRSLVVLARRVEANGAG